ncbi:MAG: hypothetical protein JST59_29545 [Actinobacteria bacterium]|nr:hypothetical protein [Actinomycetota bacterium]
MSAPVSEWDCFDILFGFPEVRELRYGVLDSDAEHVFTNGHCHSFAEALRRLTPVQLVFAFDRQTEGCEKDEVQGHVFVRTAGRFLDARCWLDERLEGADPDRALAAQWDCIRQIGPGNDGLTWPHRRAGASASRRSQAPKDGLRTAADGSSRGSPTPCPSRRRSWSACRYRSTPSPSRRRRRPSPESIPRAGAPRRPSGPPRHTEVHLEQDPNRSGAQPARYARADATRARPGGR